jgi:hypothetical protein
MDVMKYLLESAGFAGKVVGKAGKVINEMTDTKKLKYIPSGQLTPLILKKMRIEGDAIKHYGKRGKLGKFLAGKFNG